MDGPLIGQIYHNFLVPRVIESACKTFMPIQTRNAISPAIFIPRGFGESGNGNLPFLGDRGNENLFPGLRVGVRGNFGEYLVSDLKLI